MWHKFQSVDGGTLCNVPEWDENFHVRMGLTRQDVWKFVNDQKSKHYHVVDKNCQHFAYDFFRNCLRNDWIQNGNVGFESFSELLEKAWVDNRGW
jgi:hypothetical protein